MTIALFKKGNSVNVRGIDCDVCRCSFGEMEDKLKEGWVKDPKELDSVDDGGIDDGDTTPLDEPETAEKTPNQIDPIRLKAKEAGIDGWEKKRIKTLEGLLNGDKD